MPHPPRADRIARTTRRQYDRWAGLYDRVWRRYIQETTAALHRAAQLRPGEEVLDVGCGTGAFEQHVLAERPGQPITGADLSAEMLAGARRKTRSVPHACFVQADAHDLPFADASFDVVVSASVLHYLADPAAALGEMARVVRPGGRLVLLDWCRDFTAMRLLDAFLRRFDPAHRRTFAQAELCALLHDADLQLRWSRRFRHWWWGLMVAEARR